MRNSILLLAVTFSLFGCLKNDVLDKDLESSNFKESDFYTSGDFQNQFGFTIESVKLKTIVNPNDPSDILCEPTYTMRLIDSFLAGLNEGWSDKIILKLYQSNTTLEVDSVTYVLYPNYNQEFLFKGQAIECNATTSKLDARLVLEAPTTGRATASIDRKTVNISF